MSLYIPIGQIISAHGIKGEVKFRYYNEVYQDFFRYTSLYYDSEGKKFELKVKKSRFKDQIFIVKFYEISDRTSAEKLKGKVLYVKQKDLPELAEGEYYLFQLIGLNVKNTREESIGLVKDVLSIGPNHILVVEGKEEKMIPMVEDFIVSINLKEKTLKVREPEFI
ncbi:MAG: ribosome maturation factor RimM [Deltaproteobacteria bacterium]|nr:ribosome maturation factor RimM [Deltaproteobacteria bacterium]